MPELWNTMTQMIHVIKFIEINIDLLFANQQDNDL